jgi:pimeloyl-ACP methyl ester carboxylesterase
MTLSYTEAPTTTVDVDGIPFAYRQVGAGSRIPLVFLHHLTAVLDDWDPAVIDGLAAERPVIAFDNRGVGESGGTTPDNIEAMADDTVAFLEALGLGTVDLLGFSLGGMVAQVVAQQRPDLVRRLILAGTGPAGGKGGASAGAVLQSAIQQASAHGKHPKHFLFFSPSPTSQAAADAFLGRLDGRTLQDRDTPASNESIGAQLTALAKWELHVTGQPGDHRPARPGRERRRGHHAADDQFLRAGTGASERPAEHLPRFWARRYLPAPRPFRAADVGVPPPLNTRRAGLTGPGTPLSQGNWSRGIGVVDVKLRWDMGMDVHTVGGCVGRGCSGLSSRRLISTPARPPSPRAAGGLGRQVSRKISSVDVSIEIHLHLDGYVDVPTRLAGRRDVDLRGGGVAVVGGGRDETHVPCDARHEGDGLD